MECIEWSRPMAPLLPILQPSSVSKLPDAGSKLFSTPSGLTFNPLENPIKSLKMFAHPVSKDMFY